MNSIQGRSSAKTLRNGTIGRFHGGMDNAKWDPETPLFTENCAAGEATLAVGLGAVVAVLAVVFLLL